MRVGTTLTTSCITFTHNSKLKKGAHIAVKEMH